MFHGYTTRNTIVMVGEHQLCPLCMKKGECCELKTYQISLDDAILLCSSAECLYPLGLSEETSTNLIKRKPSAATIRRKRSRRASSIGDPKISQLALPVRESKPVTFSRASPDSQTCQLPGIDNSELNMKLPPDILRLAKIDNDDQDQSKRIPNVLKHEKNLYVEKKQTEHLKTNENASFTETLHEQPSKLHSPVKKTNTVTNNLDKQVASHVEDKLTKTNHAEHNIRETSRSAKVIPRQTGSKRHRQPVTEEFSHCFLQWKNEDALCWLDVALCFLVHCNALKLLQNMMSLTGSLLSTILSTYEKAQEVNRQALQFKYCANLARRGKVLSIFTTVGKITVKLGGGAGVPHTRLNQITQGHHRKTDTTNKKGEKAVGSPRRMSTKEWLMTPDELDERAAALITRGEEMLKDVREVVWQYLNTHLYCEKGSNQSPVFALPELIQEQKEIDRLFSVSYQWTMKCDECGYQYVDRQKKTLPSFPLVEPDFTMTSPYLLRPCFRCEAPNQLLTWTYCSLPSVIIAHFMDGLVHSDVCEYDFSVGKSRYEVRGVVQHAEDHFVCWMRRSTPGGDIEWLKADDMAEAQCQYTCTKPDFPASQIHLVMWEMQKTASNNTELNTNPTTVSPEKTSLSTEPTARSTQYLPESTEPGKVKNEKTVDRPVNVKPITKPNNEVSNDNSGLPDVYGNTAHVDTTGDNKALITSINSSGEIKHSSVNEPYVKLISSSNSMPVNEGGMNSKPAQLHHSVQITKSSIKDYRTNLSHEKNPHSAMQHSVHSSNLAKSTTGPQVVNLKENDKTSVKSQIRKVPHVIRLSKSVVSDAQSQNLTNELIRNTTTISLIKSNTSSNAPYANSDSLIGKSKRNTIPMPPVKGQKRESSGDKTQNCLVLPQKAPKNMVKSTNDHKNKSQQLVASHALVSEHEAVFPIQDAVMTKRRRKTSDFCNMASTSGSDLKSPVVSQLSQSKSSTDTKTIALMGETTHKLNASSVTTSNKFAQSHRSSLNNELQQTDGQTVNPKAKIVNSQTMINTSQVTNGKQYPKLSYEDIMQSLNKRSSLDSSAIQSLRLKLRKQLSQKLPVTKTHSTSFHGLPLKRDASFRADVMDDDKNDVTEKSSAPTLSSNDNEDSIHQIMTRSREIYEGYCPKRMRTKVSSTQAKAKNKLPAVFKSPRKKTPHKGARKISFADTAAHENGPQGEAFKAAKNLKHLGSYANETHTVKGNKCLSSTGTGINVKEQSALHNSNKVLSQASTTRVTPNYEIAQNSNMSGTQIQSDLDQIFETSLGNDEKVMAVMDELCETLDIPGISPITSQSQKNTLANTTSKANIKDSPGAFADNFDMESFLFNV